MNIWVPDYYRDFHCIASRCRHTCCAGWEIDIDEEALQRYLSEQGLLGEKLRASIETEGTPRFRLDERERCPFLTEENLCELILERGEEALCQICRDHPRFRNFWTGRIEIGLGLVCEEAARLILTREKPMELVLLSGDGKGRLPEDELYLLSEREKLFRQVPEVAGNGPEARLLEYLIFRHIADALYDGRLEERVAYVQDTWQRLVNRWTGESIERFIEICREYSDREEYSDEE